MNWLSSITPIQINQLFDIFISAFAPHGHSSIQQLTEYFDEKIIPRFERAQDTICAFDNGQIVGFAIFEKWHEQTYYLAEIAISPSYQGKRIGEKLVFSIIEKHLSPLRIVLVTAKYNLSAQSFYRKIGFKNSTFQHPDYPENFLGYEFSC